MVTSEHMIVIVGAVAALVLQLFLAPYIALFGIVPNFLIAFAMAIAIIRSSSYGCVMPFVLGLAFDFTSGAPLGAMALSLMVASVVASSCFTRFNNDSLFMALAFMAFGAIMAEVLYGVIIIATGYQASLSGAFLFRMLPCFLYDFALSLVLYLILRRIAKPSGVVRTELTQLR
ncbi:MAG: rod shape-determining protein MreD [Eggerthellaceae bacterium]|nr:rod shape-determining protein MreD [Eggerthellaceae bacterium]